MVVPNGCGSKYNHQGTADFSLWFHLPGFHFGYAFLTHSHMNPLAFFVVVELLEVDLHEVCSLVVVES